MLYDSMYNRKKQKASDTESRINEILKTGTIMDVIEYVGTLTDEIILKDIPQMPQFIVGYLKADLASKQKLDNNVNTYSDIKMLMS